MDEGQSEQSHMNPKEHAWNELHADTQKLIDSIDTGMDTGIIHAVTAFRAHNFDTTASCEGHLDDAHEDANPYPWIEVYPDPVPIDEAPEDQKEAAEEEFYRKNLEEQRRLIDLLTEFYTDRKSRFDAQLRIVRRGTLGGFSLQSNGSDIMALLPESELKDAHDAYLAEMNAFADFLKERFLAS